MNFFIWVIELRVKRKENKDKLKYLVERLINELELQGHSLKGKSASDIKFLSIFEFNESIEIKSNNMDGIKIIK